MKTPTIICGMLLLGLLAVGTGCDLKSHTTWTSSTSFERKFLHSVSNGNGSLRIEIETDYVGKSPVGPIGGDADGNWKTSDTDFYNYRIHNLGANPVELTSITLAYEEVHDGAVYETLGADVIRQEFGVTIIPPGTTLIRSNAWVRNTNGIERTLIRTYHGTCDGRAVELPVQLLYRPDK